MRKAEAWNTFFEDNHRYADLINGIGCGGVQFVKDTDLLEVDSTATQSRIWCEFCNSWNRASGEK